MVSRLQLLRVMRNGREIRAAVYLAISRCSEPYDLLGSIEVTRQKAEDASDPSQRRVAIARGVQNVRCGTLFLCSRRLIGEATHPQLRRIGFVLCFTSFLNETKADTWRELVETNSFESFFKKHQGK